MKYAVDIDFDVVADYRNQGIATELALALIEETHSINPEASLYIKTSTENVACKRVIEKCGGILCGYEDSSFTRSMDSLRKECEEHGFPFLDIYENKKRIEILDMIEKGRDGVCIYSIP